MTKLIQTVIFAFCMFMLFSCVNKTVQKEMRVMTYNIRNGVGMDGETSLDRVAEVINKVKPEVLAVQEIDSVTNRSKGVYVLGELASKTGMIPVYSPAIDFDGGKYGIGILCKEKPVSVFRKSLPGSEEPRTLLMVEFPEYYFASTHFSLTEEDRLKSAALLGEVVKDLSKPLIIAGDWNDTPQSLFLKEMEKVFTLLSKPESFTYPASKPDKTIDYIAVSSAYADKVECVKAEIPDAIVESDHRPVVADIRLILEK